MGLGGDGGLGGSGLCGWGLGGGGGLGGAGLGGLGLGGLGSGGGGLAGGDGGSSGLQRPQQWWEDARGKGRIWQPHSRCERPYPSPTHNPPPAPALTPGKSCQCRPEGGRSQTHSRSSLRPSHSTNPHWGTTGTGTAGTLCHRSTRCHWSTCTRRPHAWVCVVWTGGSADTALCRTPALHAAVTTYPHPALLACAPTRRTMHVRRQAQRAALVAARPP